MNMPVFRTHLRHCLTALAAVVSAAGTVAAAETPAKAVRACCVKRACAVCCCGPVGGSPRAAAAEASLALFSPETTLAPGSRPCECRSGQPQAPASRPDSRTSDERTSRDRCEPLELPIVQVPVLVSAHFASPVLRPPDSPLYLLNARLLI